MDQNATDAAVRRGRRLLPPLRMHPPVFAPAAGLIGCFLLLGATFPARMGAVFEALQELIVYRFGWLYVLAVAFFLFFALWLLVSPYAAIRLGADDEDPDYSYPTWLAMLFSAGMGIGLLFYSVAEPLLHFSAPRVAEPGTIAAAREAMRLTFVHWGLHAWAIYIVVGLALAYFSFRRGLPLTIRSTLYPLLGERVHGVAGHAVEVTAVFGTLFGVATSLGLGVMQINAGLDYLGLADVSVRNQLLLIAGITAAATTSVVTGLERGIRRLSEVNMLLGLVLVVLVFVAGPSAFLLMSFVQSIGQYAQHLLESSFHTDAFRGVEWQKSWTMFYWGWWMSWSPFVGMFIARISRGRTIREFIGGVLLVPTVLTFLWLVVFGNTALYLELAGAGLRAAVEDDVAIALFVMLDQLPWAAVTSTLATIVVVTFFITSSDSGSLVIDILTSGGDPDPPVATRIFWAVTEGAVAGVLLVTGGLVALQTAAIITALPFSIVLLCVCFGLLRALRVDRGRPAVEPGIATGGARGRDAGAPAGADWRAALRDLMTSADGRRGSPAADPHASAAQVQAFLEHSVLPAFRDLKGELAHYGREAVIRRRGPQASISVLHEGAQEFLYAVRCHVYLRMRFAFPGHAGDGEPRHYTVEVFRRSGRRRSRALADPSRAGIIRDFLEQYARRAGCQDAGRRLGDATGGSAPAHDPD